MHVECPAGGLVTGRVATVTSPFISGANQVKLGNDPALQNPVKPSKTR